RARPRLVWDLPTRLTHWLFVGCVALSWWTVRVIGHTPLGSWSVVVLLLTMIVQVTLGLFATDIDGLECGPLSHLVSFDAGRALAEAHEVSFDVLLWLGA